MTVYKIRPNKAPMPVVTAIASTPQNATRMAPVTILAPPMRAASVPRPIRHSSEPVETKIIRSAWGAIAVTKSGTAAPAAKLAAEASAAWIGRAFRASEMPSSSCACAPAHREP